MMQNINITLAKLVQALQNTWVLGRIFFSRIFKNATIGKLEPLFLNSAIAKIKKKWNRKVL